MTLAAFILAIVALCVATAGTVVVYRNRKVSGQ